MDVCGKSGKTNLHHKEIYMRCPFHSKTEVILKNSSVFVYVSNLFSLVNKTKMPSTAVCSYKYGFWYFNHNAKNRNTTKATNAWYIKYEKSASEARKETAVEVLGKQELNNILELYFPPPHSHVYVLNDFNVYKLFVMR